MEKQNTKGMTLHERKRKFGVFRPGKTAKDNTSGAKARNAGNKAARVSWQKDPKADNKGFPDSSCNGKKNR